MRKLGVLLAAVLMMLATACQSDAGQSVDPGSNDGGTAPAADSGFPRTVEHAMGETTIESKPMRVIALDQSFVDATLSLNTEVIGYTTYRSITEGLPDYLGDTLQYAQDAVSVGLLEEPNLEKIAELQPDLILSASVRHEELYDELSKIAPTVFSETTGAIWDENLRLVGEALGEEDLAEERLAAYSERAKTIGAEIKESEGGTMPTISIARFAGEPTIRLYVENSYSGVVLSDVGFPRPKDQPTTDDSIIVEISPENIPELEADHIFVATYDDPEATKIKDKIVANRLWDQLQGEQHEVSDTVWMSAVGLQGAHGILDDLSKFFDVDPASDLR